jgi:hypothetical protein
MITLLVSRIRDGGLDPGTVVRAVGGTVMASILRPAVADRQGRTSAIEVTSVNGGPGATTLASRRSTLDR